jgi:insertion element IS1 protein InsB
MLTPVLHCAHCGSEHLVSNGHARNGKQRFQCRDCKKYGRETPGSNAYDEKTKAVILAAYHERTSIRGLRRIFGVSRNTVAAWLKKSEPVAAPGPDPGASTGGGDAGDG